MNDVEKRLLHFFETEMSAEEIARLRKDLQDTAVDPKYEADRILFLRLTDAESYAMPADVWQEITSHVDTLTEESSVVPVSASRPRRNLWLALAGAAACLLLTFGVIRYYERNTVSTLYTDTCKSPEEAQQQAIAALEKFSSVMARATGKKE